jgi:hypothetical protein
MTRQRMFYGWWVTIALAVMVFLSTGGSVFGTIFVVHQGGAALSPWLGGLLFELTGGYGAVFAIASVQLLIAAIVSLTTDEAACGVARLRAAAAER